MALTFGAATSDMVACGNAAGITDLDPATVLCWVYPTTLTNTRVIWQKGDAGRFRLILSGTGGNVAFLRDRATTDTAYTTNSTPLASTDTWIFLATSFATASTPVARIHKGTLSAEAAECTYGTATNGSGALVTDSDLGWAWGNKDSLTVAFRGRIAYAALVAREMSLAECIDWQFRPRVVRDTRIFMALGFNGTGTQPDWCGNDNAGTVTGATVADHVPLGSPFAFDTGWTGNFAQAAAPADPIGRLVHHNQAVEMASTW